MTDMLSDAEYMARTVLSPRGYLVEDVRIGNGHALIRARHTCGSLHVIECPCPTEHSVVAERSIEAAYQPTFDALADVGCYCVAGRPPGWDDQIDGEPDPVLREVRMLRRDLLGLPAQVRKQSEDIADVRGRLSNLRRGLGR